LIATLAATLVAAIPTRLGAHDLAVGLAFTWHTRHEIVKLGEQSGALDIWVLLMDIVLVLGFLIILRILFSKVVHWRVGQPGR